MPAISKYYKISCEKFRKILRFKIRLSYKKELFKLKFNCGIIIIIVIINKIVFKRKLKNNGTIYL